MDKPIFDVAGLAENYVFRSPKPRFVGGSSRPFGTSRRTIWVEALWANPRAKPLLRTGDPILPLHIRRPYPDKATQRQWKTEERALIREVQKGDDKAARTLVLRHLPNLQKKYGTRLSAALEGFWRAVTLFKPGSNNGLWAYAQYEVKGQVIRQREVLGFGASAYGVLYSDAAPLGVSSDPGADEITGGKPPRGQDAETYRKGYCSNGVSQYSRNIAAYRQDFIHIRSSHDAEQRALRRLRWMGRRAYAEWLVNRKSTCPFYLIRGGELVGEGTRPYAADKIAEHYRARGLSAPEVAERYAALPAHVRAQDFPRKLVRTNKWADNGEQWKNSALTIEHKEVSNDRQTGLVDPDIERDGVHHRLFTPRNTAEHLRAAASGGDGAGGSKIGPCELLLTSA